MGEEKKKMMNIEFQIRNLIKNIRGIRQPDDRTSPSKSEGARVVLHINPSWSLTMSSIRVSRRFCLKSDQKFIGAKVTAIQWTLLEFECQQNSHSGLQSVTIWGQTHNAFSSFNGVQCAKNASSPRKTADRLVCSRKAVLMGTPARIALRTRVL